MISLGTVFWLMVSFFSLVGALRGWTKEVVATSGLILSLFALNQFGAELLGFLNGATGAANAAGDVLPIERRHFYAFAIFHLVIAFFSYQGPALAGRRIGERLRVRDNLQDKVLGAIIGAINGYLIIGGIWAFLEYRIVEASNWVRLNPGVPYPFDLTIITRPEVDSALASLMNNLPLPMLASSLPILVVAAFLFVIVVMI
ncbi:MAG: hypothetical protein GY943_31440 [Chloroflexi bacterium]|nr:hypothetical protein [Chloroflexota bacterium]